MLGPGQGDIKLGAVVFPVVKHVLGTVSRCSLILLTCRLATLLLSVLLAGSRQ